MIKINHNLIVSILRYGLLAVVFFLPFVVTPQTIYPFVFGKTLFFQSAIEILAAFYVILIIIEPRYRPKFDTLTKIVFIYFFIMVIAAIFGVDPRRSFWGTEERGTGLLTQLHLLTFFIMMRSLFAAEKFRRRMFATAVASGIFLSFIALMQIKGIYLYGVNLGTRFSSTMANPIFLAAIMLFYTFFAAYLAINSRRGLKILYSACALVFVFVVLGTETRGAVLALLAATGFFLLVTAMGASRKRFLFAGFIGIVFLAIISAAFFVTQDSDFVRKNRYFNRFTNLSADTTFKTRLLGWGVALDAFKERPFLGWGPDNFYIAFNKYYNPKLLEFSYYETWWDRPHNTVLEVMVSSGAAGVAAYLLIFIYAIFRLLGEKKTQDRVLAAGLVAYFGQNLLAFDTTSSMLLFFVILSGVRNGSSSGKTEEVAENTPNSRAPLPGALEVSGRDAVIFLLLALVAGAMVYKYNWQPARASIAMLDAAVYAADRSDVGSLPYFRKALEMPSPYKEETRIQVAQIVTAILAKQTIPQERFHEFFDFGESEIKKAIATHPRHAYFHFMLGRLYTEALNYDSSYAGNAEAAFKNALELSPKRQQTHFGYAKFLVDQGHMDEALEIYRKMVEEAPGVGEARWFYAVLLQDRGYAEEADNQLAEVGRLGYMPRQYEERLLIARVMAKRKNYQRVVDYIEHALQLKPDQAELYAQLAVAYKELGQLEEAKKNALRAAELDPSFAAEAEVFLKTLGN